MTDRDPVHERSRREVALVFLRLGLIAFGGPTAHVALMQRELVERRRWASNREFLDLLGVASLLPGPTSTELAMLLGRRRAGWPGFLLAGLLFILPAAVMVGALAWAYVTYGSLPEARAILHGIQPVVLVIVVHALVALARTAVHSWAAVAVAVAAAALSLLGVQPLVVLIGSGLALAIVANAERLLAAVRGMAVIPQWLAPGPAAAALGSGPELWLLFLTLLKVGVLVYGSGYVLLAFLRADLVVALGWLTDTQLLDAVAVGQLTPGPVFTTATFIGYLLAGVPGAVVGTVAVFLPAFVLAALVGPLVPRLRRSSWTAAFLDGATVGALALMAAVAIQLAPVAVVDPVTGFVAGAALVLLLRFEMNPAWLILLGAAAGIAATLIR